MPAQTDPDIGTGCSITFATGLCAWIRSITGSQSREAIDVSHMGTTGGRVFVPGDLYDPGDVSVDLLFDADVEPPWTDAAETVTVTFPDGATWSANGFLTAFNYTAPLEDAMSASVTIKLSGDVTVTAGT